MPRAKRERATEEPSASFHYLARFQKDAEGRRTHVGFSQADYDALIDKICGLPEVDLSDSATNSRVRLRLMAPLGALHRLDTRMAFGEFEGAYSGHAYRNTHAGAIPADSISLRRFYYLLYLSNSGRIYIGAQYLGHFGGYEALRKTLTDFLGEPETIESRAVRIGGSYYADAQPKEVKVTFANAPDIINSANRITDIGMVAFKKRSRDDGFEGAVREKLLLRAGQSRSNVKKAVAALVSESDIITIDENEVTDCTILADFRGRRRTIYMIEAGVTASKVPLDVKLTMDGHPVRDECRDEMKKLLEEQVISKLENA